MRRLATELAAARGALDVGFVVTVSPNSRLDLRVQKDGQEADSRSIALPHLVAAGVTDLDGLNTNIAEAQELDGGIKTKDAELESLRTQMAAVAGAAAALREASDRAAACRAALGDTGLDTFAADLKALGADSTAGLRKRRQQLSKETEAARNIANQAANARTIADERARHSRLALDAATMARDAALVTIPERRVVGRGTGHPRGRYRRKGNGCGRVRVAGAHDRGEKKAYRRSPERRAHEGSSGNECGRDCAGKANGGEDRPCVAGRGPECFESTQTLNSSVGLRWSSGFGARAPSSATARATLRFSQPTLGLFHGRPGLRIASEVIPLIQLPVNKTAGLAVEKRQVRYVLPF